MTGPELFLSDGQYYYTMYNTGTLQKPQNSNVKLAVISKNPLIKYPYKRERLLISPVDRDCRNESVIVASESLVQSTISALTVIFPII